MPDGLRVRALRTNKARVLKNKTGVFKINARVLENKAGVLRNKNKPLIVRALRAYRLTILLSENQ